MSTAGGSQDLLEPSDIICFANDWNSDPLSKKQIMKRLARRHRILWINSVNVRKPRIARKDFRRAWRKLADFGKGLTQVEERIWVLAPLYVPFHGHDTARKLNRRLLRWQIRRACHRLGFKQPLTWTFVPTSADVVGHLNERLIIYHCVDEYAAFSDAAPEVLQREHELLQKSDLVLVCSAPLLESKGAENSRIHLITHGVDYDHFRRATDESTPVAEELRGLPRPILGFHGLLADWVDLPLIAQLARLRPDWSIVLVGRADTDVAPLQGIRNIHWLGHRPYASLPGYLRGFDVALLPFVDNELTRAANPLKLREYLAAGLPVVAAPLPEIVRLEGLVSLAATAEEYIQRIEQLLKEGVLGPSQERSQLMAVEAWDCKVAEMEQRAAAALATVSHLSIEEHPKLKPLGLELVKESTERHSELLEYRSRVHGAHVVVKRITRWRKPEEAEARVQREFDALCQIRKSLPSHFLETVPEPLAVLPEAKALVLGKLAGQRLSSILKRDGNRLTGPLRRDRMVALGQLAGHWLSQMHGATKAEPLPHDSVAFLDFIGDRLGRCRAPGVGKEALGRLSQLISDASGQINGHPIPAASRQGDFTPQNILVDENRLAVVDFENYCQSNPIYEDVAAFAGYIQALSAFPYYSRKAMRTLEHSFLQAYGLTGDEAPLRLYLARALIVIISETNREPSVLYGQQRLRLLQAQLESVCAKLNRVRAL